MHSPDSAEESPSWIHRLRRIHRLQGGLAQGWGAELHIDRLLWLAVIL